MRGNLPRPATQIDEYLFDIALSLRELVAAVNVVDDTTTVEPGPVDDNLLAPVPLREPAQRKARKQ